MPSIDELLGHTVEELKAMSDEQLMEFYKPVFDLEPTAPVLSVPDKDQTPEEADEEFRKKSVKKTQATKKRNEVNALKQGLMDIAGLEALLRTRVAQEESLKQT